MGMFDVEDTINDVMNSWSIGKRYAQKIIQHKNNYRAVKSLLGKLCKENSNSKVCEQDNAYPYIAIRGIENWLRQYIIYSNDKIIVISIDDKKVSIHDRYAKFLAHSNESIYRFDDDGMIDIIIEALKPHRTRID